MKHDFSVVMEIQPMETLFYRGVDGKDTFVNQEYRTDGHYLTKHHFKEGETVYPDNATAMVCTRCGHTVWIVGNEEDFAQECAEKYGTPTCESQYVRDIMTS